MIVYLDTNAYIGAKYQFNNGKLNTLKNLIKTGEITLLYSSAIIGEVNENIEKDISEEVNEYNRLLHKKLPILKLEDKYNLQKIDIDEAILNVKNKSNDFFSLEGTKKISLNPLDAEKIMEDYFQGNAPFEEKKPHEFKDAIMINAIKNYQTTVNEPIHIVSHDVGFKKAFEGNDNFKVFDFLSELLQYYYIGEFRETMKYIAKVVENGNFDIEIKEYIENQDIYLDYYSQYECESKNIKEITSRLLYIEEEKGIKHAVISSDITLEIDIIYRDEDTSYYDKESNTYLIENYIHAVEEHVVNIETRWKYKVKKSSIDKITIEKIEIDDDNWDIIELTDSTMVDSKRIIQEQEEI